MSVIIPPAIQTQRTVTVFWILAVIPALGMTAVFNQVL